MTIRASVLGLLLLSATGAAAPLLLGCPASEQPWAGGSQELDLAPLEARHVTLVIPSSVVARATAPLWLAVRPTADTGTVDPTVVLVADSADLGAGWSGGRGSVPAADLRAACPVGDCRLGLTVENTRGEAVAARLDAMLYGQFDAANAHILVVLD